MMQKPKVLFLCTANSCRSQMAEGLARHHLGDLYDCYSAGTEPAEVDPRAVASMKEIGIDISRQYSKYLEELADITFDLVVTLCDGAREKCPFYPGAARQEHMAFDDPAKAEGGEEEVMAEFRRVRQEIEVMLIPYLRRVYRKLT